MGVPVLGPTYMLTGQIQQWHLGKVLRATGCPSLVTHSQTFLASTYTSTALFNVTQSVPPTPIIVAGIHDWDQYNSRITRVGNQNHRAQLIPISRPGSGWLAGSGFLKAVEGGVFRIMDIGAEASWPW